MQKMSTELKKFDELQVQITKLVAPAKDVAVSSKDTANNASMAFRELTVWEKKVEEKRKELVAPLRAEIERITEYAKQIVEPIKDAKAHVSTQLIAYEKKLEVERQEQLRIEREEYRKRQEEIAQKLKQAEIEAQAAIKAAKEQAETEAMFAANKIDEAEKIQEAEKLASDIAAHQAAEASRIEFENKKQHWDDKKEIMQNKVAGTRRTWKFKLIDISLVPTQYTEVILNEKEIKKAISNEVREISGLQIFQDLTITAR
jgi:hypothetical protein